MNHDNADNKIYKYTYIFFSSSFFFKSQIDPETFFFFLAIVEPLNRRWRSQVDRWGVMGWVRHLADGGGGKGGRRRVGGADSVTPTIQDRLMRRLEWLNGG